MTSTDTTIGPPGVALLAAEWRAPLEAWLGLMAWPWLRRSPRGDGHAVLVLPGLGGSDLSTLLLRRFLKAQGWQPHGWELGRNLGPRQGLFPSLAQRLSDLQTVSQRRVSLVGWSLGGVFARELAKQHPAAVRQVVTLGSPLPQHHRATNVRRLYECLAGDRAYPPELTARLSDPLPAQVPCTSIYSRSDGIVHWRASLLPKSERTENIRVSASHSGMGFSPLALRILADRLAQREDDWQPYRG